MVGMPAGFKPNENLKLFLCDLVLRVIDKWNVFSTLLVDFRITIVIVTQIYGVLGLSVMLAAVNDTLFLCSFWLLGIYSVFAFVYSYVLHLTRSMYRLLRGLKYNTLRKKDDMAYFSVPELYLGVVIFTSCIFLLPTLGFFYLHVFVSVLLRVMIM